MKKQKLQKKFHNWELEQFDIHHKDLIEMCRTGYVEHKSWKKTRHWKKEESKI